MKKVVSQDVLLAYPDFSKPFDIHTDASHSQLGAAISQDGKPIAFYSRKLNLAQTRYTTTKRELLAIVETLKEFRNILLGQQIRVYTDHKNLTYEQFTTERVLHWRLMPEEYGPELIYTKGTTNVVADALSRLDMTIDCNPPQDHIDQLYFNAEHFGLTKQASPLPFPSPIAIFTITNNTIRLFSPAAPHPTSTPLRLFVGPANLLTLSVIKIRSSFQKPFSDELSNGTTSCYATQGQHVLK